MNQQAAGMTYAGSGVDYDAMDPFKRAAQLAARQTAGNILRLNDGEFREVEWSRGESVYLIEAAKSYFAHVEEGLGTKNLVADPMYIFSQIAHAMANSTLKSYYDQIAQCAVATIVNDMITLGALPLSVAMHLAVSSSDWFKDEKRSSDLINGWKMACDLARCTWGGGETPTLKGNVDPVGLVLAGSAIGIVTPKDRLINPNKIGHGDAIVMVQSSGVHANGYTLCREIAGKVPGGYLAKLSDGRLYGEALLDPTCIYVGLIEDCFDNGVDIHYAVNITGHGWRKLLRANRPFTYVIKTLGPQLPIFDFIQKNGPVTDEEAYGNFNMGAGFALYVRQDDVATIGAVAANLGLNVWVAGHIENGPKRVLIVPKDLKYDAETLAVR